MYIKSKNYLFVYANWPSLCHTPLIHAVHSWENHLEYWKYSSMLGNCYDDMHHTITRLEKVKSLNLTIPVSFSLLIVLLAEFNWTYGDLRVKPIHYHCPHWNSGIQRYPRTYMTNSRASALLTHQWRCRMLGRATQSAKQSFHKRVNYLSVLLLSMLHGCRFLVEFRFGFTTCFRLVLIGNRTIE